MSPKGRQDWDLRPVYWRLDSEGLLGRPRGGTQPNGLRGPVAVPQLLGHHADGRAAPRSLWPSAGGATSDRIFSSGTTS